MTVASGVRTGVEARSGELTRSARVSGKALQESHDELGRSSACTPRLEWTKTFRGRCPRFRWPGRVPRRSLWAPVGRSAAGLAWRDQ